MDEGSKMAETGGKAPEDDVPAAGAAPTPSAASSAGDAADTRVCPICSNKFPASELEAHANTCLDTMQERMDAELAAALHSRDRPASGATPAVPPAGPAPVDAAEIRRIAATIETGADAIVREIDRPRVPSDEVLGLREALAGMEDLGWPRDGPPPPVGAIVAPGPDWSWGNQHRQRMPGSEPDTLRVGYRTGEGIVVRHAAWHGRVNEAVIVRWANGGTNTYRWGARAPGHMRGTDADTRLYDLRVVRLKAGDEWEAAATGRGGGGSGFSAGAGGPGLADAYVAPPPPLKGVLLVKPLEAITSAGNPMVRVTFEQEMQDTKVEGSLFHTGEVHPRWDDELVFRVRDFYAPSPIRVSLMSKDTFREPREVDSIEFPLGAVHRPVRGFEAELGFQADAFDSVTELPGEPAGDEADAAAAAVAARSPPAAAPARTGASGAAGAAARAGGAAAAAAATASATAATASATSAEATMGNDGRPLSESAAAAFKPRMTWDETRKEMVPLSSFVAQLNADARLKMAAAREELRARPTRTVQAPTGLRSLIRGRGTRVDLLPTPAAPSRRLGSGMNPLLRSKREAVLGGGAVAAAAPGGGPAAAGSAIGDDGEPVTSASVAEALRVYTSVQPSDPMDRDPWLHDRWVTLPGGTRLRLLLCFISQKHVQVPAGPMMRKPLHWAALHCHHDFASDLISFLDGDAPRCADATTCVDLAAAGRASRYGALGSAKHHADTLSMLMQPESWRTRANVASLSGRGSAAFTHLTGSETGGCRSRNTLHMAVLGGDDTIVNQIVLLAPQLATQKDDYGMTPFALACAIGKIGAALALIGDAVGSHATARDEGRGRVVHGRWVIGPTPELLAVTRHGETPLMLATRAVNPHLIGYLAQHGGRVATKNAVGDTALHLLCRAAGMPLRGAAGADSSAAEAVADGSDGATGLPHAAALEVCARQLVDAEAGARFPHNDEGDTPLHLAAAAGRPELVKVLLSVVGSGTVFEARDAAGRTPVQIAEAKVAALPEGSKRRAGFAEVKAMLAKAAAVVATPGALGVAPTPPATAGVPGPASAAPPAPGAPPALAAQRTSGSEWAGDDDEYVYESDGEAAGAAAGAGAAAAGDGADGAPEGTAPGAEGGDLESKTAPAESDSKDGGPEEEKDPDAVPGWFCDACTFLNPVHTWKCSVCDTDNKATASETLRQVAMRVRKLKPLKPKASASAGGPGASAGGTGASGAATTSGGGGSGASKAAAAAGSAAAAAGKGKDTPMPLPPGLGRQVSHEVLDSKELAHHKMALLRETADALRVPVGAAGLLLRTVKWDANALVARYVEEGPKLLESAGVTLRPTLSSSASGGDGEEEEEEVECPACMDDKKPSEMFGLGCGHLFCKSCWAEHLDEAIKEGPSCLVTTKCMMGAEHCSETVDELSWAAWAREKTYNTYERHLQRSFIDLNTDLLWCPNPDGCDRIVKYSGLKTDLQCTCGYHFCFRCGMEAHAPATCDEYTMWKELASSLTDKPSISLMMEQFKRCPQCKIFIDKNMGCKHMTCQGCRYEFCWNCKAKWTGYGHRCENLGDMKPLGAAAWNEGETSSKEKEEWNKESANKLASDTKRWTAFFTRAGTQGTAMDQVADRLLRMGVAVGGRKPRTEEPAGGAGAGAAGGAGGLGLAGPRRGVRNIGMDADVRRRVKEWQRTHRGTGDDAAVAAAISEGCCTYVATTRRKVLQPAFHCQTCGILGNRAVCLSCVERCHRGHEVAANGFQTRFCGCAESRAVRQCLCLAPPSAPELERHLSDSVAEMTDTLHADDVMRSIMADMERPRGAGARPAGAAGAGSAAGAAASASVAEAEADPKARDHEMELKLMLANLWTFHNILKFTYVHIFFNPKHSKLLDDNCSRLELATEYLFALTDTSMGTGSLDFDAIRAYSNATRKYVDGFLEDLSTELALKTVV